MNYTRKQSMRKLIYLEMIALSILLVVAVVIFTRRTTPTPFADKPNAGSSTVAETEALPETDPTWKTFSEDRELTAQQYFVFDRKDQQFVSNSLPLDTRIYPSGISRLFTAYVICETTSLGSNSICTVEKEVLDLVPPGSTVANLKAGDVLTAPQLMESMLITNANDAAFVLACAAGRYLASQPAMPAAEAVQFFVSQMNYYAMENGMLNTNFVNPNGTHNPNQYTTFHDLVILVNLCARFQSIAIPVSVSVVDIKLHGETIIWQNPNELLNRNSEYYCPYAIGLITDQVSDTGTFLLSTFYKNGQNLLIGVFGCPTPGDSFDDALQLFNQIVLK